MKNIIILILLLIIGYMTVANHLPITGDGIKNTGSYVTPVPTHTPSPTPTPVPTPIPTPVPTPIPTPIPVYDYDNIRVKHEIIICNPVSDDEFAITGIREKNCGHPDFVLSDYPLDNLPSGGDSGKVSKSEMIFVKVNMIEGDISLIPWETETISFDWYDNSDKRLMFHGVTEANSFDVIVNCIIGHFSWEINKKGQYYVDIGTENGDARVVFDIT